MSRQDRRSDRGIYRFQNDRDGLFIDLHPDDGHSGPCSDLGVVAEQRGRLWGDVRGVFRDEAIGPVPPVETRMRHQSLQTAAERKGGGDHDDSQGGAEQG